MQNFAVVERIKELCSARSWTYYRLAKESGISYSTLNTMLNKTKSPSIATLCHICDGFGITLSQFFSDEDESVFFTPEQKAHLALWDSLSEQGKQLANTYIQGLLDMQRVSDINSLEEN